MILTVEEHIDSAMIACDVSERLALRLFQAERRKLVADLRGYIKRRRWYAFTAAVVLACSKRHISVFEHARLIAWAIDRARAIGKELE